MKLTNGILPIILLCSAFKAQVPTNGLIGYYPFVGSANDFSGNLYNGTVFGPTLTADRFGNPNAAYQFNGVSDYIDLPASPYIGLNNYSYSLWFKALSNSNNGRIICVGENGGLCQSLTHQTSGYLFASSFNLGNNPNLSYSQSSALTLSQWHHAVVTRDLVAVKMYIDGLLVAASTPTATNGQQADYGSLAPQRALIGARSSLGSSFFFHGIIDDVRYYNRVLTPSEVTALYNEPPCYLPAPSNIVPSASTCSGNSVTLTTSASGTVNWFSTLTGSTAASTGSAFVTPGLIALATATQVSYYLEVNSCTIVPRTAVTITVYPSPSLSVSSTGSASCARESVTLTAMGASSYSWSENAISFSVVPTIVVSPSSSVTYSLTGIDSLGCVAKTTYSQSVNMCLSVPSNGSTDEDVSLYYDRSSNRVVFKSPAHLIGEKVAICSVTGQPAQFFEIRSEVTYFPTDQFRSEVYFISGDAIVNTRRKVLLRIE